MSTYRRTDVHVFAHLLTLPLTDSTNPGHLGPRAAAVEWDIQMGPEAGDGGRGTSLGLGLGLGSS